MKYSFQYHLNKFQLSRADWFVRGDYAWFAKKSITIKTYFDNYTSKINFNSNYL